MADLVTDLVSEGSLNGLSLEQIKRLKAELDRLEVEKSGQATVKDNKSLKIKDGHVIACPHCGCADINKHGPKGGIQRYHCKGCNKTFGDTTGKLFYRSRLSTEQKIGLIKGMLLNLTLQQISDDIGLSVPSVHRNRKKICNALQELFPNQDNNLTGIVECDEYMVRLSFKGKRDAAFFIDSLGRLPKHHRSRAEKLEYLEKNGLLERLSRNPERLNALLSAKGTSPGWISEQASILTCRDSQEKLYINPVCVGRMENQHAFMHLGPIINKDAIMVTDSYAPYANFAAMNNIHIEQLLAKKHTKGAFNLGHINALHSRLTTQFWPNSGERSPATKYLDLELALFWWMEKHRDMTMDEKVSTIYGYLSEPFYDNFTYESMVHRKLRLDTKGLIPQVV